MFKRYPVVSYFVLTFFLSWGLVLFMMAMTGGLPSTNEQTDKLMPVAIVAMLVGPALAGMLMTALADGREGFRQLLSRLLKFRVGIGWWAVALLAGPLVSAVLLAVSLLYPQYLPPVFSATDKTIPIVMGLVAGVLVGICEELGWTGFAIPHLRQRYSVFYTALILGAVWGAWHILTNDIWASQTIAGDIPRVWFVLLKGSGFLIGNLVAFRVLMVWVYDRTGSLPIAMLMHAGLAAFALILSPSVTGLPLLIFDMIAAAIGWIVVAVLAVATGSELFAKQSS